MPSILVSQCLQQDFVGPVGPWDPLPCTLHIGAIESGRLLGPDPSDGPLSRFCDWAHAQPVAKLRVLHVRDHHDPGSVDQKSHLEHFGNHCVKGSAGAEFVFRLPDHDPFPVLVDSGSLNDFQGSDLADKLDLVDVRRVGIVGVWTDAKVCFLAYELRTRFPHLDIAVCSALTASSSRERHLFALDHLERVVGVRVLHSIGEFASFLVPDAALPDETPARRFLDGVRMEGVDSLTETDHDVLAWLFRSSGRLEARVLDGGFSGNMVLGVKSVDLHGHDEVPHVVKIGPREAIGRERAAFESIEPVLGNAAPRIVDVSDFGGRGGIKYRYASMTGSDSRTFQSLWMAGLPMDGVEETLRTVLSEQLGRLYRAASAEPQDLLELWDFRPEWADGVERRIASLATRTDDGALLLDGNGISCPDPVPFYRQTVPRARGRMQEQVLLSRVHGDLNGANILLDGHSNAWIIDFFHSRRHALLCDFAKLENDLVHLWTPVDGPAALREQARLVDLVTEIGDLASPPLPAWRTDLPPRLHRTWDTLRILRQILSELVGVHRHPWQMHLAALRYAAHTLSFDEATEFQKKGALHATGRLAHLCRTHIEESLRLRVDRVPLPGGGSVGLTILPGRKDRARDLASDLDDLVSQGTTHLVSLVTDEELDSYGVADLGPETLRRGIAHSRLPILDQKAASPEAVSRLVEEIDRSCRTGNVVVHCVGGLGRSGLVAACLLVRRGMDAESAIRTVREHRSPRAVETRVQEDFVRGFAAGKD